MEDKNELSDIVLDKNGSKFLKFKRILIIIAILIIIFLAVLLSMKLLNKPKTNNMSNLILPPEPVTVIQKEKKDEELFRQVPITEENKTKKDNFEKIVKDLKEKDLKEKDLKEKDLKEKDLKKEIKIQPVVKAIKKLKQKIAKKSLKNIKSHKATNGIYIQVGATSKFSPDKKFLEKIKKQKLNYRLLGIKIKGKKITKILVGPFKSRAQAKANLANARKKLNKHAYIYSVK